MTSINIPNSVTSIGDHAFHNCNELPVYDGIQYADSYLVKAIESRYSYVIKEGTRFIGEDAFNGCSNLHTIRIPYSVTSIGDNAFYGCTQLYRIENLSSLPLKKGSVDYGYVAYYASHVLVKEGDFLIRKHDGQIELYEYLGSDANVILPNVDAIMGGAFSDRNDIQSIVIPNSVTRIGGGAFRGCSGLTSIVIPESVKTIEYEAFSGCKLRDIQVLATNPPSIFESTFSGQSQYHTTLFVPVGCWDAYAYDDTYWYLFINIKENASVLAELNESQAYTLKSVATRSYIVYDAVNDAVGSIGLDANIDESDPNNSWQVIEQDGKTYIYNIGAKKYLTIESVNSAAPMRSAASTLRSDFKWGLSTTPVAISLSDGEGGVHIDNTGDWLFVLNEQINIDEEVVVEPEPEEEELPELLEFADKTTYNRLSKGTTDVKYSRTFNNTNWQALYVPFSIPVEVLTEKGLKIAELNDTHQWDSDGDGIADSTCIEFFTLGSGSTLANHPYLIKADEAFDLTLELSDVQLMAAKENSINCSSTKQMFTFCGTYTGVSGADMYSNNYYAMVDGSLKRVSGPDVSLMPQRWFLKIENRDGTPVKYFAPTIRISIDGIDGEPDATGLSSVICREEDNAVYSLDGVRQDASRLTKGLYIQNGQKVIVR